MHYLIVGASRGLGAALVTECLRREGSRVIGIGRSAPGGVQGIDIWAGTGRFRYVQADVTDPSARPALAEIAESLPDDRLCIIYNAAIIRSDVTDDGVFLADAYREVSEAAVAGIGTIVDVFARRLQQSRGILVGMSSFSALYPPFVDCRIAYPASKAFLSMALRSLRLIWKQRVSVMVVYLGLLDGANASHGPSWLAPSYETVAGKVLRAINRKRVPLRLILPKPVYLAYVMLYLLPEGLVNRIIGLLKLLFAGKGRE